MTRMGLVPFHLLKNLRGPQSQLPLYSFLALAILTVAVQGCCRTPPRPPRPRINCAAVCWGSWGSWGSCSAPCGSGRTQYSFRSRSEPSACRSWADRNGCPGKNWRTRSCHHNCKNGGSSRPGWCACTAGWRGTCCDIRITCGFPGKPSYGEVSPLHTTYNTGSTVRFTCNTGYQLSGSSSRTCSSSGHWTNSAPSCNIVRCPDPGIPADGTLSGSDFSYGKFVVYTCNTGFVLVGSSAQKCQANGQWSGEAVQCQRVPCPELNAPAFGDISVPADPVYGSVAKYSCQEGHFLLGSRSRRCLASGQWGGSEPTCKAIMCPGLATITNGQVSSLGEVPFSTVANYSCHHGYMISGNYSRTCISSYSGPHGVWTGTAPSCSPVSCGDPGTPANGARSGSVYTYPSTVSFLCQPGYVMKGTSYIRCQADAEWSGSIPTCTACTNNTYKSGSNVETVCAACPANSHVKSVAGANVKQCICDVGYEGPAGGPCSEIRCGLLPRPAYGHIVTCNTSYGSLCQFDCADGYILSSGDASRTCRLDKTWSGEQPVCTACLKDTYKYDQRSCHACPADSHTAGPASMKRDCVCNHGYQGPPGGPCNDTDECAMSGGGCEQECHNTPGSFRCVCSIPGYGTDPENPKACVVIKSCSKFPNPDNGGAVCSSVYETNTQRCQVRCNPGYDHLDRPNVFEQCGPTTNWKWSFEITGEQVIPPCVEEYFPGVQNELELFYFVSACSSLSAGNKQRIRHAFTNMLKAQGVCKQGTQNVCVIDDVRINCGVKGDFDLGGFDMRKKRSTSQVTENIIQFKFNVKVPEVSTKKVDCTGYCKNVNTTSDRCKHICRAAHKTDAIRKLNTATTVLKNTFNTNIKVNKVQRTLKTNVNNRASGGSRSAVTLLQTKIAGSVVERKTVTAPEKLVLNVGGLRLFPATTQVKTSQLKMQCEEGTVPSDSDMMCVECPPGTYARGNACEPCAVGTYQPRSRQVRCQPCPAGSRAPKPGSSNCE